jgi:hypothetical protein
MRKRAMVIILAPIIGATATGAISTHGDGFGWDNPPARGERPARRRLRLGHPPHRAATPS